MSFDIYLLYASIGLVCSLVIGITLNRVRTTTYRETIDYRFCHVLGFFILFCLVDAVWGIVGSPFVIEDRAAARTAYVLATYGFHLMAAWSAFMLSYYGVYYLKIQGRARTVIQVIRYSLIVIQMVFILQNIVTGTFFTIDELSVYHTGILRYPAFYLQYCHYIPLMLYALVCLVGERDREKNYIYRSYFIFSCIALLFGVLQMLYPDGAFYSLGFLVVTITIYAYNVTSQREGYLEKYHVAMEHERNRAEIEEALAEAEAANRAKTIFLSNMSHDIRTPINGIMGMVTIVRKEEMSPKVEACVNKIDSATHHLLTLINDVLDLSRIESG